MKLTRGTIREDGFVFWHYSVSNGKRQEVWLSPEKFRENKERVRLAMAESRKLNPQRHRDNRRRAYAKNPMPYRNAAKRWAVRNPEKVKVSNSTHPKRWRAANPEKVSALHKKRRAIKKNALHPQHSIKIETAMETAKRRLQKCLGMKWAMDHIVPLAKGGWHHHTNLQLLPFTLNSKKSDNPKYPLPDCYITPDENFIQAQVGLGN